MAAATDSSGTVVDTFKYDPYGNITSSTGTLYEPIRFAGGYSDNANGTGEALYKFGERYYDPILGRWTQQDPIDNPLDLQGWNQYKYAGDNPVNLLDPTGLGCAWYDVACHASSIAHHVGHWVRHHVYETIFAGADLEFCLQGAELGAELGAAAEGVGAVPGAIGGCLVNALSEHIIVHRIYQKIRSYGQ